MQNFITLNPIKHINGNLNLPGSKSISNRVLLLAAQATGTTHLVNLLDSSDVRYMLIALDQLGVNYYLSANRRICTINGLGRPLRASKSLTLFLGNSGTAMRSLAAALCLQKSHEVTLTGEQRMKERPINHLVDALRQGSARVFYLEKENYPPLRLCGGYRGGDITVNGSISSQFLSALLMMAPMAPQDSRIYVQGKLVSRPYIDITIALMKIFGITVRHDNYEIFYLTGNSIYRSPSNYLIEGDASSASYFLAAAAIRGGTVRVNGISDKSIQGDIHFADVLKNMGAAINWGDSYVECSRVALRAIDIDMNNMPDVAMTMATTALFASGGATTLRNISNWRFKETNRLKAMTSELRKVGAIVIEGKDYLSIIPPVKLASARICTYNDHRMAMCFALVALSDIPITILNPSCTYKTFPDFFAQLAKLSTTQS